MAACMQVTLVRGLRALPDRTEVHAGSKLESEWVLLRPGMLHGVCARPLTCSHLHYCSKPLTWF